MIFPTTIFKHTNYTFEGKKENEEVKIFLYSYWIVILFKSLFYAFISIIPLVPFLIFITYLQQQGVLAIVFFFLIAYYMLIWSLYFYELMLYLLDNWIVTNERILDIVQKGFFNRTTSELSLHKVQDITVKTHGFIQTMFDFGDVEIETAGAALNKFKFRQVPRPNLVKDRIMKLVEEAKAKDIHINSDY